MFRLTTAMALTVAAISTGLWGWVGLTLIITAVLLVGGWFYLQRESKIIVPELTVGVVYKRKEQAFVRFLEPGIHWIHPFTERVEAYINTAGQSTNTKTAGVQAIGGLPLEIEWTLAYGLVPHTLSAAMRPKMARALPYKAAGIAHQQISNCLHHVIGDYTIEQLCEPGIHRKLERQVRQLARTRLEPLGFDVMRIMIDAIHMPKQVMTALEEAHEREMQAENEAKALEKLQKVVSQFSQDDMERLMELERIHMLGKHGLTMLYPTMMEQLGTLNGRRPPTIIEATPPHFSS